MNSQKSHYRGKGGLLFERTGIFTGSSLIGSLLVATSGAIIFLYGVRVLKKA
jgi:uncharacterized membrane protein YeaQ/YmgE (transglycosylase-associated protein family)